MNKPMEQRMCPFCLNKQIGDEHHYIFKCTHPKFIRGDIDKLRVVGVMKNKLILLLFCFAQRFSCLVTLKTGKVWLLG